MANLFHKVKQSSICQDVVEQIQTAILDGQISAGERLPPEREMALILI